MLAAAEAALDGLPDHGLHAALYRARDGEGPPTASVTRAGC